MTAKQLNRMVSRMRTAGFKIDSRESIEDMIYCLVVGLKVVDRSELPRMLENLYNELEDIDTEEIMNMGIF